MLLRNFYNTLAFIMTGRQSLGSASNFGEGFNYVKKLDGSIVSVDSAVYNGYIDEYFPMCDMIDANRDSLCRNIVFGTGNTPVTFNDYTLTNYKYFKCNGSPTRDGITYDSTSKTFSNIFRCNYTNNTGADMVIKEIGITMYQNALIYREVLETPFTVPAGKTFTFTHEFKFAMPM